MFIFPAPNLPSLESPPGWEAWVWSLPTSAEGGGGAGKRGVISSRIGNSSPEWEAARSHQHLSPEAGGGEEPCPILYPKGAKARQSKKSEGHLLRMGDQESTCHHLCVRKFLQCPPRTHWGPSSPSQQDWDPLESEQRGTLVLASDGPQSPGVNSSAPRNQALA